MDSYRASIPFIAALMVAVSACSQLPDLPAAQPLTLGIHVNCPYGLAG